MTTSSLLIKTNSKIKKQAQKKAKEMGTDLTDIINRYLEQFVKTKSSELLEEIEIPNEKTAKELEQAEKDFQTGNYVTFNSPREAHDYIALLIKDAKQK
jgi:antitoxin component of RelBE/YafQ-DinJ toxin-antitoxin module